MTNENAAGGRRDLRPARRHAAGDRARRRPDQAPVARTRSWPGWSTSSTLLAAGARDLPERQQTLRGAIAWSYDLLDDGARRLLDRLSVFPGGCDLERPRRVCGPAAELGGDVARRADGAGRPEPGPGRRDGRRRAALPDARDDPRVRRGTARGARRDRRRSATATRWRARPRRARRPPQLSRRRPAQLARPARARARQHPGGARLGGRRARARRLAARLAFAMWRFWQKRGHLAEARARLEADGRAGLGRTTRSLRARLAEALGGVAGGSGRSTATRWYDEALAIWRSIGDKPSSPTPTTTARYAPCIEPDGRPSPSTTELLERTGAPPRAGPDALPGARRRRGEPTSSGASATTTTSTATRRRRRDRSSEALAIFSEVGDRTMEAWSLHMLGLVDLCATAASTEARRDRRGMRSSTFHAAGDVAGHHARRSTTCRPSPSSRATSPRAARLRGAARQPDSETGTGLAATSRTRSRCRRPPSVAR